jgi:hypothetical protein
MEWITRKDYQMEKCICDPSNKTCLYHTEIHKLADAAAFTSDRFNQFLRENKEALDGKRDSRYRLLIQERDSLKGARARAADRLLQFVYTGM